MAYFLRDDWDSSPHIDKKFGEHSEREEEHKLLLDFLYRRAEGALLISGKRGVGKTSTVFSAILEVKPLLRSSNGIVLLPVLVNAPSFEVYEEQTKKDEASKKIDLLKFKRVVLQNLIRRLYKEAVLNLDTTDLAQNQIAIQGEVSRLYRRAIAREVKSTDNLEELKREDDKVERQAVINVRGAEKLAILGASFVAAGFIARYPIIEGAANTVISALTALIPLIGITLSWERKKSSLIAEERKATEYYLYDYDIGTLQYEFEEVLNKLPEGKFKPVFVIDELDKMKLSYVKAVITSLKTLFNHSSAIFILITGREFFDDLLDSKEERPKEYTLFSQRIFLKRPSFKEMESFIDGIVVANRTNEDREAAWNYRMFRNYVCFESKTDFFDLYNVIRDNISGFDGQRQLPLLNLKLNQKQVVKANLQKAMGQIYIRKAYSHISNWHKNDALLDQMYRFLMKVIDYPSGTRINILKNQGFKIMFHDIGGKELGRMSVEDEIERSALSDLLSYLMRLDFLKSTELIDQYEIRGVLETVQPIEFRTEEELNFINNYERFLQIGWNLHGQFRQTTSDL